MKKRIARHSQARAAAILLAAALALGCASCAPTFEKQVSNLGFLFDANDDVVLALDTEVTITTVRDDVRDQMVAQAQDQIFSNHRALDGYHAYADPEGPDGALVRNLAYLNEHIGQGPVEVDPILFDALREALAMAQVTRGYFNPTVGKLVDAYEGRFSASGQVAESPDEADIDAALATVVPAEALPEHIVLDEAACTVELVPYEGQDFAISLGAIAKGYALEHLAFSTDSSYLVSAGTSSMAAHVAPGEQVSWNLAVHEPDSTDILMAFSLDEGALSTSGDDQNYYITADGKRVHHILNPFTGRSESFYRNVVVLCDNAAVSDALSTALFNVEAPKDVVSMVRAAEELCGSPIDYCLVSQEGQTYALSGNEGFFDRLVPGQLSSKVDQRMLILEDVVEGL